MVVALDVKARCGEVESAALAQFMRPESRTIWLPA